MRHFRSVVGSPSSNKFMRIIYYRLFQETGKSDVEVTSNSTTFIPRFVKIFQLVQNSKFSRSRDTQINYRFYFSWGFLTCTFLFKFFDNTLRYHFLLPFPHLFTIYDRRPISIVFIQPL